MKHRWPGRQKAALTTGTQIAMKLLSNSLRILCALTQLTLVMGCASTPPAPPAESLLLAAGFKTVVANTARQLQHLPTLPTGQVTVVTQTGKNYYVYPDLAKNQIYVGTDKQYQAYLKLRQQNNLPNVNPEAAYFKQDAAMRNATVRDESAPWEMWPSFNGLGWE
jgi:hypothetical protein